MPELLASISGHAQSETRLIMAFPTGEHVAAYSADAGDLVSVLHRDVIGHTETSHDLCPGDIAPSLGFV